MSRHKYIGEGELILTNSCEGTRVVSEGDVVCLPDTDTSLDDHPLFKRARGGGCPHVVAAVQSDDEQDDGEPLVVDEPTA